MRELVEEIARIIDPRAWAFADEERKDFPADPHDRIYRTPRLKDSLSKAQAILGLVEGDSLSQSQPKSTLHGAHTEAERSGAFTPGPWVEDEACICSLDGVPVAQTCRRDEFWTTSDDDMPDAEVERISANARLIAAAPDLLEALLASVPEGWLDDDTMEHMPGIRLARAAIAKAFGPAAHLDTERPAEPREDISSSTDTPGKVKA